MTQQLTTPKPEQVIPEAPPRPAQNEAGQYREQQRIALRDLVQLATEAATTETEIERKNVGAVKEADDDFKRASREVEEAYAIAKEQVETAQKEREQSVMAKIDEDLRALHAGDKNARQRIRNDTEPVERDIKSKFDQAIWMAESVFEVAAHTAKEEFKKVKDQVEEQRTSLDGMEAQAWSLLNVHGLALPDDDDSFSDPLSEDPRADVTTRQEVVQRHLSGLLRLKLPSMFTGASAYVMAALLAAIAGVLTQFFIVGSLSNPRWIAIGAAAVIVFALMIGLSFLFKSLARSHIVAIRRAISTARRAMEKQASAAQKIQEQRQGTAVEARRVEVLKARERFKPILAEATRRKDASVASVQADFQTRLKKIESDRATAAAQLQAGYAQAKQQVEAKHNADVQRVRAKLDQSKHGTAGQYTDSRRTLAARLRDGLATIQTPMDGQSPGVTQVMAWDDPAWDKWVPPKVFPEQVRIGDMEIDLPKIAAEAAKGAKPQLELPPPFKVPVTLGFPRQASLLIQTDRDGRPEAIKGLQMTMSRLLTLLPPGRVRFTIIDPVGLGQNFAGFMHLADHDEALVGGRIWTEAEHIEQRLTNLTEHMETVIQKYLRNEYETIDEYNAQAGELAEPYRFLVISDFPHGFQGNSYRRLASIAQTGARCGVYTLITRDIRQSLPSEANLEELEAAAVNLVRQGERFIWKDPVFSRFPLTLDAPPSEEFLTKTLDVVGKRAKEANRVEVSFDSIAPKPEQWWTRNTIEDIQVPIGRMGATKLQNLRFGKGMAQHGLIAGKTGSGKSTLLHAIITNVAMWYSPNEVEVYLIDFKKGVEFKTYAAHLLPHARAIAVESDREFGISVLQRLDGELVRRGEIFRRAGVQDLGAYRRSGGPISIPRTLLMIDEFQEFFSEDDKLAAEAGLLLDRLVRQGRAFGIHVLLGSQTIGGTGGLARSTIGQMAVRIALQTSEADSHLILGDGNSAARLLSRPGEGIYNDQGGLVEGNSPFQVAWLTDERRDIFLNKVTALNKAAGSNGREPPVVFEGNAAADIHANQALARLFEAPKWPAAPTAPVMFVGDPVAIKEPTSVTLRRQAGANVLIMGQQDEGAMAMMVIAMLSLAGQHAPGDCKFYIFDGSASDSPLASVLPHMKNVLPHPVSLVDYRAVDEAMGELMTELKSRQTGDGTGPAIYVMLYGLQRYRVLRKTEEAFGSFSMGSSDEPKAVAPDKLLMDLLKDGPGFGIHVVTWCDTAVSLDRTFDRAAMREFDNRILFQMSANDSSNLIDSPAANKLGFHRALAYSEEQGTMEKFRPYGLPEKAWLEDAKQKFAAKK